ncbi:hypothetical protein NQZ68_021857 [Dissostichus eleginoides]|nr:hypothetical protein NQZ68_021857 [Dissostichus eleginoides]
MAEAPRKKAKTYHFHEEWEEEFICLVKDKCVCMLCHQTQALAKEEMWSGITTPITRRSKTASHPRAPSVTLFNDFKNKEEIKTALKRVPLGPPTVTRRVESLSEDVDRQNSFPGFYHKGGLPHPFALKGEDER